MDDEPQSLQTHFASAKAQKKALEAEPNANSDAYRQRLADAISAFIECQKLISKFSIFSPNESVDDITTGDLQFLTVNYLIADLRQRSYTTDRLATLRQTRGDYERFLESLDHYDLLSEGDKLLHERYLDSPDSFSLAPTNDATARRQVKITRFREEKELKQKLEYLSQGKNASQNDEDIVRQVYLAEIKFYTHQTFQSLDMLSQELSILNAAQSLPPVQKSHRDPSSASTEDGYSDRLDIGLSQRRQGGKYGAILSKDGKPLKPFTLTSQRTDIQKGVFRSGHNLPTMTIEDYLEEEKRRGGVIEGGGEASGIPKEVDEDDLEIADAEVMKARAWDEYTEANPKGSGNTLNRG